MLQAGQPVEEMAVQIPTWESVPGNFPILAAVGVETKNFEKYQKARVLEVDAGGRTVRILK